MRLAGRWVASVRAVVPLLLWITSLLVPETESPSGMVSALSRWRWCLGKKGWLSMLGPWAQRMYHSRQKDLSVLLQSPLFLVRNALALAQYLSTARLTMSPLSALTLFDRFVGSSGSALPNGVSWVHLFRSDLPEGWSCRTTQMFKGWRQQGTRISCV